MKMRPCYIGLRAAMARRQGWLAGLVDGMEIKSEQCRVGLPDGHTYMTSYYGLVGGKGSSEWPKNKCTVYITDKCINIKLTLQ